MMWHVICCPSTRLKLLGWVTKMSVTIDRIIKSAEKSIKFGDFQAATSACYEGLEAYPNNPRLTALARRLLNPQMSKRKGKSIQEDRIPMAVVKELRDLSEASEWLLLTKRCLELLETYENSSIVWMFLGCAQRQKGYPLLSKTSHMRSKAIDPEYAANYSNMGNTLVELDEFDAAEEAHKMAVKLDPTDAPSHNNLGALYEVVGRHEEALGHFQKAHSLDPNYASAEYNLAGANLLKKNFKEGWKQRETRWKRWTRDEGLPFIETSRPLWDGSDVDRLYVWSEQGVGDEIMFASTFNELASKCNSLVVACAPRLKSLFERTFGDKIAFVDRAVGLSDEEFDCHAPAMTATGLLRQDIQDFCSSDAGYLKLDECSVQSLRKTLQEAAGGRPVVGISWLSKNKKVGKRRSISPVELVAAIPEDVFLLNLQYGDVIDDVKDVRRLLNRDIAVFDNIDNFSHLEAFACLIAACDKVVSIDNSTVHFAGAVGKECHVLLPKGPDWRWGREDNKFSYWYSSLLLHRQTKPNDWNDAIQSLQFALNENSPS